LGSLREMVTALPDPYRQALILSDVEGVPQQDLARQTGISLSGIKSRVQRARSKVKEALLNCFEIEFDPRGQVLDVRQHCCC
jgi:RNA polymerase sigma-70 factor (ECF subfamily)